MKTKTIIPTLVILFVALCATAQQGINYKAIINDANGSAIVNTAVTVQFTILENGTTPVYQETQNPTTDNNGIIIVNIGEGTVVSGVFNDIDWGSNPHFLKTEIDKGEGLTDMGTTEFKVVPYALFARTAGSIESPSGINESGQYFFRDKDGDQFGDQYNPIWVPTGAIIPDFFVDISGDCDDDNENINPSAIEIQGDGIDQNCDGIDENLNIDNDGDGFSENQGDCNDYDNSAFPGAGEFISGNDDNCDGIIDNTTFSETACIEAIDLGEIEEFDYFTYGFENVSGDLWFKLTILEKFENAAVPFTLRLQVIPKIGELMFVQAYNECQNNSSFYISEGISSDESEVFEIVHEDDPASDNERITFLVHIYGIPLYFGSPLGEWSVSIEYVN